MEASITSLGAAVSRLTSITSSQEERLKIDTIIVKNIMEVFILVFTIF
jgi:hypothetical protein